MAYDDLNVHIDDTQFHKLKDKVAIITGKFSSLVSMSLPERARKSHETESRRMTGREFNGFACSARPTNVLMSETHRRQLGHRPGHGEVIRQPWSPRLRR